MQRDAQLLLDVAPKLQRERLNALRETTVWLRDVTHLPDDQQLHLRYWRRDAREHCGMQLCLAGWYVERHPGCGLLFTTPDRIGAREICSKTLEVCGWNSLDYLAEHFGLDYPDALWLFMANQYPDYANYPDQDYARRQIAGEATRRIDNLLGE
jgi:hypothetical protein